VKPTVVENGAGDPLASLQDPGSAGFYPSLSRYHPRRRRGGECRSRANRTSLSAVSQKKPPKAITVVEAGQSFRTDLREAKEGREVFAFFLMIAIAALVAESILGRKA
jgi:hypothetical protein